jgi:hypothetical protein
VLSDYTARIVESQAQESEPIDCVSAAL